MHGNLLALASLGGLASQVAGAYQTNEYGALVYQGPHLGLDFQTGKIDEAPPGYSEWTSPLVLPSPNVSGAGGWEDAVAKAKAFVGKLTLDEKINLTTGVGTDGRCVGNTGRITRLDFAGLCLQDSPLGVRDTDRNTAFPAAINVATTWDKGLMRARGEAMGAEHRGKGVNVQLGPMTNLGRVPEGGRNWEGFGADPFLAGVGTSQTVQGIQSQGVIACTKHYIANEQEHYRGGSGATAYSSDVDDRTMHELYVWPFAEAVLAGTGAIMCSYNRINQTFACENSKMLNGILKEELDFQGFVVSDWAALESGVNSALAGTDMDMPGFQAYGDSNQPNPSQANNSYWGLHLKQAVLNGSVPMYRLEDMVTRTLGAYYMLHQDEGYPPVNFDYNTELSYYEGQLVNLHVNVQSDHYKLVREIGGASTVLLKNTNQTLPLDATKLTRVAIIGSDAAPHPDGPNICTNGTGDHGCDEGTLAMGWGSGTANFPYLIDPSAAITQYIHGASPTTMIESLFEDYNYAALPPITNLADVCFVFANADSGEGYITVDDNEGDRNNLTLWHSGDQLILNTAANCTNTIVVLHQVGPVIMESWIDHPNVKAVLAAGLPGQESGNAIVDVLFGAVNPSGRLPYTIAKKRSDYPADVLYSSSAVVPQIVYKEKLLIDYRWFDSKGLTPRFEFGYGLSYTSFRYTGLSIDKTSSSSKKRRAEPFGEMSMMGARDGAWSDEFPVVESRSTSSVEPGGPPSLYETVLEVTFAVTNDGNYDGYEVSQLYLGFPPSAGEPPRVLRGFERTQISKGEDAKVTISLRRKDISIWDVTSQSWVVPQGTYTVYVGGSSRDLPLEGTFEP